MTTQTIKPSGDLVERAKIAYFARCTQTGLFYQQPAYYSGVQEHNGKSYVVLENINGPLAVYRVRGDGRLEYVEDYTKWPGDLGKMPDDYLAAWAQTREEAAASGLTREEAGEDLSSIVISREGSIAPEQALEHLDGYVGTEVFEEDAADALLASHGYRRVGLWIEGSMNAREQRNPYALVEGRSCEVVRIGVGVS